MKFDLIKEIFTPVFSFYIFMFICILLNMFIYKYNCEINSVKISFNATWLICLILLVLNPLGLSIVLRMLGFISATIIFLISAHNDKLI